MTCDNCSCNNSVPYVKEIKTITQDIREISVHIAMNWLNTDEDNNYSATDVINVASRIAKFIETGEKVPVEDE